MKAGFDKATVLLVMDGWRDGTKKVYTTYLRKWGTFCIENKGSLMKPTLAQVCKFLRGLAQKGLGYGAINAARSALATILPMYEGYELGKHPVVCLLVKGVYERNPPKPRYESFWDVNKIFVLFKSWGKTKDLTLKLLTLKLIMLLLLVSSQRGQTIVHLSLRGMIDDEEGIQFLMPTLLKHNRLGDRRDTLKFNAFPECKRLCIVRTIREYVRRTKELRAEREQLLISFASPHGGISRDTLSRWVLTVLKEAEIDTDKYKSHSTRGASASAAKRVGVGINLIMRQAGWRNVNSFARFYDKDIDRDTAGVGNALLQNAH